jgi:hypothetical protein
MANVFDLQTFFAIFKKINDFLNIFVLSYSRDLGEIFMKYVCLLGTSIIACGLVGFGYFSSKNMRESSELIEVKGLSEKSVKADVGEISITIQNSEADLEKLYKKHSANKDKVSGLLKSLGVTDEEIVNFSTHVWENEEEDKTISSGTTVAVKKRKYYKSDDKINVRSKDFEKIDKIKEEIVKLSSEGIFATYDYAYYLTNFSDIKMQMMREASQNARKSAEAFIEPHGQRVDKVVYLRQGEITIRSDGESEDTESWNSKEKTSVNKKLRLVVRAGFTKTRRKNSAIVSEPNGKDS